METAWIFGTLTVTVARIDFLDPAFASEPDTRERGVRIEIRPSASTHVDNIYASPEQEQEIRKLRKEEVEYARLIREQEKDLRRQKDELAGKITLLNVVAMPVLVILFGLSLFIQRRRSTRAR